MKYRTYWTMREHRYPTDVAQEVVGTSVKTHLFFDARQLLMNYLANLLMFFGTEHFSIPLVISTNKWLQGRCPRR